MNNFRTNVRIPDLLYQINIKRIIPAIKRAIPTMNSISPTRLADPQNLN